MPQPDIETVRGQATFRLPRRKTARWRWPWNVWKDRRRPRDATPEERGGIYRKTDVGPSRVYRREFPAVRRRKLPDMPAVSAPIRSGIHQISPCKTTRSGTCARYGRVYSIGNARKRFGQKEGTICPQ